MKNIYKRRLDDQAKIFSLSCNRADTSLFRLSTNLKQKVDKEILNQALLRTLEKYKKELEEKLNEKLNKEVILNYEQNEDILGGLVVKIEDKVIDLSLKTKFDNLRKN